jgi:hypothetical protein
MTQKLNHQELKMLLEQAREAFPHEACLTCECFLGYVAQLGIDAGEDVVALLAEMGIDRKHTHNCLGCEPCPPADLFAKYSLGDIPQTRERGSPG